MEVFDKFSLELVTYLRSAIKSTDDKHLSNDVKRQMLWTFFHRKRIERQGKLKCLWEELVGKSDIIIDDPLLEQSFLQELYEMLMKEYFESISVGGASRNIVGIDSITPEELNVIRYACGYVARSLLKRYETKCGDVYEQYVTCLVDMAVKGENETDLLSYTREWLDLVNRGGLFPLNDETFQLFIHVELCVRTFLPQHLVKTDSDKETFKRNVHEKILRNEDVQFHWTLISQYIELPENAEVLLNEIIQLWVTVRVFSIAGHWIEVYKNKEKTNTKKSKSLTLSFLNCFDAHGKI